MALVLLGTTVAAGVTVRGRLERAAFRDARRALAVDAADALLTRWWARDTALSHPRLPRRSSGTVAGDDGLAWRTDTRRRELTVTGTRRPAPGSAERPAGPPLDRVRLEIYEVEAGAAAPALYAVELLLPAPPPRRAEGGGP